MIKLNFKSKISYEALLLTLLLFLNLSCRLKKDPQEINLALSQKTDAVESSTTKEEIPKKEPMALEKKVVSEFCPSDEAYRWLADHQEPDGHWDAEKYQGEKSHEVDCAVTGMAVLAYLNNGHISKAGRWNKTIKLALNWLVVSQKPNGSWASNNYTNAICTLALADATGMGEGKEVKKSAELATEYILKQQNANGLFDYSEPTKAGNMSVTGWCIMALKSALLAEIKSKKIIKAHRKCEKFLNSTTNTKDNTTNSKGLAWYTPNYIGTGDQGGACQAIAIIIRQYGGWLRTEPWLQAAIDGQITHIPTQYENMYIYRVYFTEIATYQHDHFLWKTWDIPVKKIILAAQRRDDDYRGSWDPTGDSCNKGGRVFYTAIFCSIVAFQERYPRID